MSDEKPQEERRMVNITVKAASGVDPEGLFKKITTEIVSQPEYKLKWDDTHKVEGDTIHMSFTIGLEADFDEEVMEVIEMMEDEVANQQIIFQTALE
mmetsp:Transcript_5762/g.8179  ORF Transcript_5762/g.8179 Transcript_5762/m.8179 type:complete len:97 (+) Transcript_5762:159-449(+)|eukprot:CAMPEP_0194046788 /NCGR_PEP_ID=MMETSP0009_2-20130614/22306_1 /TAXON_ID=210454 /ORGANISM="Grammatophora oceanica, Strain CCMP 410" /LENGTH=96 /DNA_ID=CAMNT_0038692207 /DNA_START=145 /DNA_END=435 /DNA_ORIENTATION=-